ncbi:MAG: DUF2281 domain-containing protein [Sulfuricaulis sp.]|nr:DUF2281 domain-containing protein [Sulfuricaulis sp.]
MAKGSNQMRTLLDKLDQLPPERVAEVENFVEFLANKERDKALGDFLAVADAVAKTGVPALTPEEIEAEIKAYRDERRRAARP